MPLNEVGSYVLLTRAPLASFAGRPLDLHVLGLPPAFVLSQDQALRVLSSLAFNQVPPVINIPAE